MTEKYAHLAPEHLRSEMVRTERPTQPAQRVLEPSRTPRDDDATQVVDSTNDSHQESRGSSEAEQLIRNQ